MKGGLESSSLRVSVFREISASRQRGCGEGIDCGCVERFLPNWVIKVKRDDRELLLVVHVRGLITGKTRETFVSPEESDHRTLTEQNQMQLLLPLCNSVVLKLLESLGVIWKLVNKAVSS